MGLNWISVQDIMPDKNGRYRVIIVNKTRKYIFLARYNKELDNFNRGNITHWLPN